MKTISPWFQTAALMSAIRHAIRQSGNRTAGPTAQQPTDSCGSKRFTPQACRSGKDRDIDSLLNTESHEIDGAVLFHHSDRQ
jgi:hypothetical protein